jgi:hypothetical protein
MQPHTEHLIVNPPISRSDQRQRQLEITDIKERIVTDVTANHNVANFLNLGQKDFPIF